MSKQVTGKTVYILGAGASAHQAPMLNNFLVRARSLWNSKPKHLEKEKSFKRLFDFVETLRSPAYYLNMDLENIEHVFSLIATMKELNRSLEDGTEPDDLFEDIKWVIYETLEHECKLDWPTNKDIRPDDHYKTFIENILGPLHENKIEQLGARAQNNSSYRDSIITLNYDVLLDNVFFYRRKNEINYGFGGSYKGGNWKVLKLHGSLNWGYHEDCPETKRDESRMAKTFDPEPTVARHQHKGEDYEVPIKVVTQKISDADCKECEKNNVLEPLIIPPTWSKKPDKPPIESVWNEAINELQEAFQIVIIGYSMPDTDTFLPYLLSLGLTDNRDLHRVLVVDKDNGQEFKRRYKNVFSKAMIDRDKVQFLSGDKKVSKGSRGITFADFVDDMNQYVSSY